MLIKMLVIALVLLNLHFVLTKVHIPPRHGGKSAKPHQYPWMISLQFNLKGQPEHCCGASLIAVRDGLTNSDIVVTAAHCLSNIPCDFGVENLTKFSIIAGEHLVQKVDQGEEQRKLSRAKCHEKWHKYTSGSQYDIALVKLQSPIEFTSTIKPIRLPKQNEIEPETGSTCVVAGWGYLNKERDPAIKLQHANVTVDSQTQCEEQWKKQLFVTYDPKLMICAGAANGEGETNRVVACDGDSGSPLMCNFDNNELVLTGLVSWGDNCPGSTKAKGRRSRPDIYTKVSTYSDWIRETIKQLSDL